MEKRNCSGGVGKGGGDIGLWEANFIFKFYEFQLGPEAVGKRKWGGGEGRAQQGNGKNNKNERDLEGGKVWIYEVKVVQAWCCCSDQWEARWKIEILFICKLDF